MGLTWFILGFLSALYLVWCQQLQRRCRLTVLAWVGLLASAANIVLAVAWGVAATLEGEPQAAAMGILIFAMTGLMIFIATWRWQLAPRLQQALS